MQLFGLTLPSDIDAAEYEEHPENMEPVKFLSEEEEECYCGEERSKRVEVDDQAEVQMSQSSIVDSA